MKNIVSKTALLALTIAGTINAADAIVTALPRVARFHQIEQFEHLPYPLNFIEAHRALTKTQRKAFLQDLSKRVQSSVRETFRQCERYSQQPFPYNVLGIIEGRMNEVQFYQKFTPSYHRYPEFTDILQAHPDLATIPYPGSLATGNSSGSQPAQTALALRTVQLGELGLLKQLLESSLDPRIRFDSPERPHEHQKPLLRLGKNASGTSRAFAVILDYAARTNGTSKAQPFYHQLGQAIQKHVPKIGSDVADLIVEFTPTEAVSALQAYRENGKSLLDLGLERLACLDSTDQHYAQRLKDRRNYIDKLLQAGIPAITQTQQLEAYLKERRARRRRTATITGTCAAAAAGLAYWWFNKK